jgi:hypothetical protein
MGYFPANNDPAALPAYPADGGANTVDYEGAWLVIPDITVSCNNTVSRVVWRGLASADASTPYNAFPSLLGCADSRRRFYGDLGFRLVRTVVRAPSAGGCAGAFHFNATTATCEPDQRACLASGISGFQSWDGIQFGACTKCPVGSVAQGTQCAPVASRTVESGPNVCGTTGLVTGLTLATNTVNGTLTSGDSIGGFRDSASAVVNTRSDKYSVTLLAGETMVATLRNPAGDMDPYLLLYYPLPRVFYTNVANGEALKRVETGLRQAWQDGSLQALWRQSFGPAIAFAGLKQRRMLRLENPFLEGINFDYRPYFYNPMTDHFGEP